MGVLAVFGVVASVAGLGVLVAVRAMNKPQTVVVKAPALSPKPVVASGKPWQDRFDLSYGGDPLLADVNGDHTDDVIVFDRHAYVAFNTRTKSVVWRTPELSEPSNELGRFAWIAGKWLAVARGPELKVFDLATGRLSKVAHLAERVVRPCASAPPTVARVSLGARDVEVLGDGSVRNATGECVHVDSDGVDPAEGADLNPHAARCESDANQCLERVPVAAVPKEFLPVEDQLLGSRRVVLGQHRGHGMLLALDGSKLAWTTALTPPNSPSTVPALRIAAIPTDPALVGWQAADRRILLFRTYELRGVGATRTFDTSIEGLDIASGKRVFVAEINDAVSGARSRDTHWVLTTPHAIWQIEADGTTRKLIGSD